MRGFVARDGAAVAVEREDPTPGPGEVRIRVRAAGLNRADLLQLAGRYPPPPGAPDVLGLECAGVVDAVGDGAPFAPGDRVAALVAGGGLATHAVAPAGALLPLPADLPFAEAAALPEALATVFTCLHEPAGVPSPERVVWHAGASGVGTTGIQVCRALGADVFVTVGTADKLVRCRALGASGGWIRDPGGFVDAAKAWAPQGADVIVDPVGGPYVAWDQEILGPGGRLVLLSFLAGRSAQLDLQRLLLRGQTIRGTTLRGRSPAERAAVVAGVAAAYWPWVATGRVGPVVDSVWGPDAIAQALDRMRRDESVGKLVVTF